MQGQSQHNWFPGGRTADFRFEDVGLREVRRLAWGALDDKT